MTSNHILAYVTLLPVVVTPASLVVGIVIYYRQSNAQVFLEYTKRYSGWKTDDRKPTVKFNCSEE